ncbi:DNA-processing protein DprA [Vibrio gallaecicus]|uniref:DNA-processing protein DprA n=1 Tax=Vibrio gallaecicus TaxID=552386 RepID=UPI0010CA1C1B|nr:DNA-processing protein DprA [Vibrio gallaecicus]MDN3615588.1 DNA-processing protein DprA [Vibrio gallaecicus]
MNEQELSAWLTLSFIPQLGGKRLSRLLAFDSPLNIVQSSSQQLQAFGLSPKQVSYLFEKAPKEVDDCLAWLNKHSNHHIITSSCSLYPKQLANIASAPSVLFVKGQADKLIEPQIAMVGSRNATLEGLNTAKLFAQEFVKKGLIVTSGLALGIDGYAHDGALKAGGETFAVLGSGLESIYPARHRSLAERIVESGALISEFRPHAKPRPEHFPRRNRIISGLSLGTLVVEAAEKSGSLITARYALEQDREVFALPGSIHTPTSRGGNSLIKAGACLVQSAHDVLFELESLLHWSIEQQPSLFPTQEPSLTVSQNEQLPFPQLLANVGIEATPVDILAQRTHIPVHEVMMQLLELELLGHVVAVSGGYIRKGRD